MTFQRSTAALTTCALILLFQLLLPLHADAKIEALFHPHDPTLEKIASWIEEAESRVDIAMYNMDTTDGSPVIQTLKSESIQARLQSGEHKFD